MLEFEPNITDPEALYPWRVHEPEATTQSPFCEAVVWFLAKTIWPDVNEDGQSPPACVERPERVILPVVENAAIGQGFGVGRFCRLTANAMASVSTVIPPPAPVPAVVVIPQILPASVVPPVMDTNMPMGAGW